MYAAKMSTEVRALADHLQTIPHGTSISYVQLSAIAGFDVCIKRHCLARARALVMAEIGAGFDCERGRGLRRLTAEQVPGIGMATRKHCRLAARRAHRAMTAIMKGFNDVDTPTQRKFLAETSVLGLLELISRDRYVTRLERRERPLAVAATARILLQLLGQA
jgi:hypothetical protein